MKRTKLPHYVGKWNEKENAIPGDAPTSPCKFPPPLLSTFLHMTGNSVSAYGCRKRRRGKLGAAGQGRKLGGAEKGPTEWSATCRPSGSAASFGFHWWGMTCGRATAAQIGR